MLLWIFLWKKISTTFKSTFENWKMGNIFRGEKFSTTFKSRFENWKIFSEDGFSYGKSCGKNFPHLNTVHEKTKT